MIDWGLRDQATALTALADLVPGTPRWVIGHSIGGLWLAFRPAMAGGERIATVGSGLIHVTDHPFGFRMKARAFWQGPVPDLSRRLGFAPGRLLGFGAGLPLGVCADWRRWSLTNGFHLSDVGSSLQAPDTSLRAAEMRFVAV
ncbi:MAG: hypothetical protein C0524_00895 [Rhodobacter sp.]|nr:hypothetical protein [Rhodobacter sp.]